MRFQFIACKVMQREAYLCAARSENVVDVVLMPQGLHNEPDTLRAKVQEALDRTADVQERPYDASLLGYGPFSWANYNLPDDPARHDKVCRPCWRIHFQNGCVHRCHYCGLGGLLATMVNVEDYIVHLDRLIEAHPWQET